MSDNILKVISTQPAFVPSKETQTRAVSYLNVVFDGTQIDLMTAEDVEFVDQGANFESVDCNVCGEMIPIELWQTWMDTAFERNFNDLSVDTECCNKVTSLNDLQYITPAGFAKFVISIINPKVDIADVQLQELERILGTEVRTVQAHY